MIVYLAGYKTIQKYYNKPTDSIWLLSSFFEHKGGKYGSYVEQKRHILDSGAFSTFKNPEKAKTFDWDSYVRKYIQFIKHTKQELFFEMDIDIVVGLKKVEYYRKQIEDAVGIAPIPVWHSNRGWEYFINMCENYSYVAIGTTSASHTGKKIRSNPMILSKFINKAHEHGCKIHGLGFTYAQYLKHLKFDSVDSTTWNVGGKYGNLIVMDKDGFPTQQYKEQGTRVRDTNGINCYNFDQWVKFQKYAYDHL